MIVESKSCDFLGPNVLGIQIFGGSKFVGGQQNLGLKNCWGFTFFGGSTFLVGPHFWGSTFLGGPNFKLVGGSTIVRVNIR